MPGVNVTTVARTGSGDALRAPGSRYFVTVQAEKGDTALPVRVKSMADYVNEFGNRVTYGFGSDDLQAFFEEGGTEAYIARVVGPAASKGLLTLVDRAGTPLSTLRLTAFSEGAWSANLTAAVANGAAANTFTVTVSYKAGTVDEVTEVYRDLPDPATAVARINSRSRLVVASNLGSATAAPTNNPAVLAATALSTGADDQASITATHMTNALARFGVGLGPGAVAVPGYDLSLVGAAVVAHCKANRRAGLLHDVVGDSIAGSKTLAATVYGTADYEHAGLFFPWVKVADGNGGTRTVPPTGFVAGKRAAAHQVSGPWRWPAGKAGLASFIVGTDVDVDKANGDTLNTLGVSAIRTIVGVGIELYGWRSLSSSAAFYSLAARDTLNTLAWQAGLALEGYTFSPIDSKGVTVNQVKSELTAICEAMRAVRGLYELRDANSNLIDPGYSVSVTGDPAARTITANVAVRVTEAAETINVTLTKVTSDQAV